MHFGISTILYGDRPLAREHLAAFAAQGFGTVELFAVRGHFDYQDAAVVDALAGWLAETGLTLHSVHAPVVDRIDGERWGAPLSIASADAGRRARAVREVEAALAIAARVPFRHLVVHVGTPDRYAAATADDTPEAARRSLEALAPRASGLGVRLALEVLRNRLSSVEALVGLIDDLEIPGAGLCLDFGHVHRMDGLVDGIEAASGHITTTHVHDVRGDDDHLVPFAGTIDWGAALMAAQKVGYEGPFVLELAGRGEPADVLRRARQACRELEALDTW